MKHLARRQVVNLDSLPTRVREALMVARGKPVRVMVPTLGVLELPVPKDRKLP